MPYHFIVLKHKKQVQQRYIVLTNMFHVFWLLKILGITCNVFMLPGHLQTRQKQKSYYTKATEIKVTSQTVKYRDNLAHKLHVHVREVYVNMKKFA